MLKRLKKLVPLMLTLSVVSTAMVGCGNKAKEEANKNAEIEFWTISLKPKFDNYFTGLIEEFQKSNPNIKVKWSDMPYDALQQKLLSSIASGEAPDVVNLNTETALQMAGKDALINFDKEISSDDKAIYFEGLYKAASNKNGVYGLPWYTGAPVLFMNKDLIAKAGLDVNNPPKTQEEMRQWAKVIKDKTGKYGMCSGADASALIGQGIALLSDDKTKATFNNDEAINYINATAQLFKNGYIPKEKNTFDKEVQYLGGETTAMMVSGTTLLNRIKSVNPKVYENLVVAPAPVGKANINFAGTMNIAVPKATKNKEAAIKFAKYVTNAKNQLEFSKVANTLPSTKDSIKDEFFKKDDGTIESKAKIEALKTLETVTDFSIGVGRAGDIRAAINKAMENVYLNGSDAKKELEQAEKAVNDILKEQNVK